MPMTHANGPQSPGPLSMKMPRQAVTPHPKLRCPSQQSSWPSQQSPSMAAVTPRNGSGGLEIDDLFLGDSTLFDPCNNQALKAQLLQKMHMRPNAVLGPMRGGIGGCNAGMWILRDISGSFVLKLVRICPMGPPQATESEKFAKLCRENPGIVKDPSLAFPCKILRCLGKGGNHMHDLVAMRQVQGVRMSEFIMTCLHTKKVQDLMRTLEQFGVFLADFHGRYNSMQHGDLTPANIFFDTTNTQSSRFTLVDVADLAPRNPVIQSDTERFISSLKLLSTFYGAELFNQGKAQFEAGYNARRSRTPSRKA